MSSNDFKGAFKDSLNKYITLKTALGYSMSDASLQLHSFDNYVLTHHPDTKELTQELALGWCDYNTFGNQKTQYKRAMTMRMFAKYLESTGKNAFVLPNKYFPKSSKYIPYIYTDEELIDFFDTVDNLKPYLPHPLKNLILPIVFRMMYLCGLRSCEISDLKIEDIDLENGHLTIIQSKNDNSRIVPMPNALTDKCAKYLKVAHGYSPKNEYFFLTQAGLKFPRGHIYSAFRSVLDKTNISHRGRGKGPRAHDFRHTFAIHRLKWWVENDMDLQVYFPILKAYMGHSTFNETSYYLKMTADVYPRLVSRLESKYPDIIPELKASDYETN